jgi:hypothetical protein
MEGEDRRRQKSPQGENPVFSPVPILEKGHEKGVVD